MDVFVHKFQPDRYKLWKAGKDNAPIDHSKPTLEAAEFLEKDKMSPSKEIPSEAVPEEPSTPEREDMRSGVVFFFSFFAIQLSPQYLLIILCLVLATFMINTLYLYAG